MRWAPFIVLTLSLFAGVVSLAGQAAKAGAAAALRLPTPARTGRLSLEEALARRRSLREFTAKALTDQQLGQLLWAAQGVTDTAGRRTAPSAGALYPLEVYVATRSGLFHYEPGPHQLIRLADRDLRSDLASAALGQEAVQRAAAVFVIAADISRTAKKYGPARSPRYVHLEAGHAAQNLLLQAVSLGLGGVPVGAFSDARVKQVAQLPPEQEAIYMLAVGYPR